MCSSCAKRAAAMAKPGKTARKPLVLGVANGEAAQTATVLKDFLGVKRNEYIYVSGTGVSDAVDSGLIKLGYKKPSGTARVIRERQVLAKDSEWFVRVASGKWHGFRNLRAAERYAKIVGSEVVSRDQAVAQHAGEDS